MKSKFFITSSLIILNLYNTSSILSGQESVEFLNTESTSNKTFLDMKDQLTSQQNQPYWIQHAYSARPLI